MLRSLDRATSDGLLISDDTVQEKAWTDENEWMCWHYDHVSGRNVPMRSITAIPVAFELVKKPIEYCDIESNQRKRKSAVTKHELMREMIATCLRNRLKFRLALMHSWFAA
jgi:hypothetical protein